MPEAAAPRRRAFWLNTALLLVALVALVATPLLIVPPAEDGEGFGGTDSAATTMIEESGYRPWFSPIFEPKSGEVESGLFALQAAIGSGALCWSLATLRARRRQG